MVPSCVDIAAAIAVSLIVPFLPAIATRISKTHALHTTAWRHCIAKGAQAMQLPLSAATQKEPC